MFELSNFIFVMTKLWHRTLAFGFDSSGKDIAALRCSFPMLDRSRLHISFQSHALDRHVLNLACDFIHSDVYAIAVESDVEDEMVHVRDGVQVE